MIDLNERNPDANASTWGNNVSPVLSIDAFTWYNVLSKQSMLMVKKLQAHISIKVKLRLRFEVTPRCLICINGLD